MKLELKLLVERDAEHRYHLITRRIRLQDPPEA